MRALLALALLAGCGTATIAIEDYNAELARADCEQATRCGLYDRVDRCLAFAHPLGPITPSITSAVAAGLVTYDAVQAYECVDEHAAMSCAQVDEAARVPSVTCRGVLRAGRIAGDPCVIDEECASRACASGTTPFACSVGTCVEPAHLAGPGEDCSQVGCSPDTFCAPFVNTCVALLPIGAPCDSPLECAFGLDCFDTCQPPPVLGDPCPTLEGEPTCGSTLGLACDLATNGCVAPLGLGDACDPDDDLCANGWLACAPDRHVCEPFPAVGAPCGTTGSRCTAGAVCAFSGEGASGVCVPLVDDGSPCSGFSELCASGVCDQTIELCVEPKSCV